MYLYACLSGCPWHQIGNHEMNFVGALCDQSLLKIQIYYSVIYSLFDCWEVAKWVGCKSVYRDSFSDRLIHSLTIIALFCFSFSRILMFFFRWLRKFCCTQANIYHMLFVYRVQTCIHQSSRQASFNCRKNFAQLSSRNHKKFERNLTLFFQQHTKKNASTMNSYDENFAIISISAMIMKELSALVSEVHFRSAPMLRLAF